MLCCWSFIFVLIILLKWVRFIRWCFGNGLQLEGRGLICLWNVWVVCNMVFGVCSVFWVMKICVGLQLRCGIVIIKVMMWGQIVLLVVMSVCFEVEGLVLMLVFFVVDQLISVLLCWVWCMVSLWFMWFDVRICVFCGSVFLDMLCSLGKIVKIFLCVVLLMDFSVLVLV